MVSEHLEILADAINSHSSMKAKVWSKHDKQRIYLKDSFITNNKDIMQNAYVYLEDENNYKTYKVSVFTTGNAPKERCIELSKETKETIEEILEIVCDEIVIV